MSAPEPPGSTTPPAKSVWYRRRAVLVTLVVAVVIAITVITDLPVPTSRAADISSERSVMSELNTDLAPCALAVHEAFGFLADQSDHTLSASDRELLPNLLADDENACSFTNESIFDLSNIEVPGSPAGKDMGNLVATASLWTTSDALAAIEAVQTLMSDPTNANALSALAKAERALARDRRQGLAETDAADHTLDTVLTPPDMPASPSPGSSS